jgi:hypothetical protein
MLEEYLSALPRQPSGPHESGSQKRTRFKVNQTQQDERPLRSGSQGSTVTIYLSTPPGWEENSGSLITAFRDAVGRTGDMGGRRSTSADMYRSGVDRLCRLWSAEVDRPQPRQTDLADVGPERSDSGVVRNHYRIMAI